MSLSVQLLTDLGEGTAYFFSDWPNSAVPTFGAGVYTIWLDAFVRRYIHENLSYRFVLMTDGAAAYPVEKAIKRGAEDHPLAVLICILPTRRDWRSTRSLPSRKQIAQRASTHSARLSARAKCPLAVWAKKRFARFSPYLHSAKMRPARTLNALRLPTASPPPAVHPSAHRRGSASVCGPMVASHLH
jgi:hypothetical protein